MRTTTFLTTTLLSILVALPAQLPAQVDISIKVGSQLGPEMRIFAYSPARYGAWRTNYRRWTPTVIYEVRGHYYHHDVRGARAIVVYVDHGDYFFPPDDKSWIGFDKRYDYTHRPVAIDFARARPYSPPVAVERGPTAEIAVWAYTPERDGGWRRSYMKWTPVMVYEYHGRYYANGVAGARAVELYRYHDEYFLPPHDDAWVGLDKRYDYVHQPTDEDRARGRKHG